MFIGTAIIKLHAPWVHSLKEKRAEVQKLTSRVRNKFNASVCEVEMLDIHKTIVLGVGCVANSKCYLYTVLQEIVKFVEVNTNAEVFDVEYDTF
ncbi:MAG: DUF503 domain-containing protein [Firmicutes bacterium]|nr:DUF503 domain-containing protein [Bacillota bacterium]MDD4694452.1 DUF503 domain-containing protein [Bacillota bacterium]